MKNLLAFITIAMACICLNAATPSYENFDPAYFTRSGNTLRVNITNISGPTNGITAAVATNISAYQSQIATNNLVRTNDSRSLLFTNIILGATNGGLLGVINPIIEYINPANGKIIFGLRSGNSLSWISGDSSLVQFNQNDVTFGTNVILSGQTINSWDDVTNYFALPSGGESGGGDFGTNLSPIHFLEATKRNGQSYSPGNFSGAVVTNSQYLLIGAPGTEGVVRELVIVPFYTGDSTINSVVKDLRLLVYADSNLTVNVSLAELCGMRYHPTSEDYILNRQSYYANTYVETTNAYSLSPLYQMFLKFPMPYTNGCWARITNTVGGSNWVQGYMTAYVDRTPIPTAIRDYRMYCYSTNQALSGAASNYWTTVTGSGQIVGMAFGLTNSNPTGVAEFEDSGGFGFWLNNAVQWEPGGMDDFFHATIGGIAGREFIGEQVGITRFVYDGVNPSMQEGYRWMPNDSINFTNGFTFYTDGGVATEAYFNLWYYRKP